MEVKLGYTSRIVCVILRKNHANLLSEVSSSTPFLQTQQMVPDWVILIHLPFISFRLATTDPPAEAHM